MKADNYISLLRDKFCYLFDEYRYQISFLENESINKIHIGLASEIQPAKLLFIKESGGGGVPLIGSPSAPFFAPQSADWFGLLPVLYYLGASPIRWEMVDRSLSEVQQAQMDLDMISGRLKGMVASVLEMFHDDDHIATWARSYDVFLENLPATGF